MSGAFWLALVVLLFCLPLFVGLGRTDMENDEAIYSFAADVIVASGDWLTPKSSPWETAPFLEKPPLKFWIVAAPIRLGLLPDSDFGMRFWDAVFGSVAFLYLFLIGRRIGGPVCGVLAVLMLFVHRPLVFEHGLRSNNMEAALVLACCGAICHFLMWKSSKDDSRGRRHVFAIALFFVLAFMTKFVAALFLPMIIALVVVMTPDNRARLVRSWRVWLSAATLAALLIAPWFLYQHIRFGSVLWEAILGSAVYTRFTAYLNPTHLQPWHYYVTTMWNELVASQTALWTVGGLAILIWRSLRSSSSDEATILLWFALPIGLISIGTSKIYHYAYPFLPPLALAAGYFASVAFSSIGSVISWLNEQVDRLLPRAVRNVLTSTAGRTLLMVVIVASGLMVLSALALGPFKVALWSGAVLRVSTPFRALPILALAIVLYRRAGPRAMMVAVLILASVLPITTYRRSLSQLSLERHPVRSLRDCIQQVRASNIDATGRPPIYVEGDNLIRYQAAFYFRALGRWSPETASDSNVFASLSVQPRPVLLTSARFRALEADGRIRDVPAVPVIDQVMLLPGPFGACAVELGRVDPR